MNVPIEIFVLGDSISKMYGQYLQGELGDGFHYTRKTGEETPWKDLDTDRIGANGGNSRQVLGYLRAMQNTLRADVLLVNCGLHDIRRPPPGGDLWVPLEEYAENLKEILNIAQTMSARVVWITTTEIDEARHNTMNPRGVERFEKDNEAYHQKALGIMKENNVPVLDLRTFTASLGKDIIGDHIHFTEETQKKQAAFIAEWLKKFAIG